ncbi:putative quinol monooxygenase [Cysteiniphilum litorale]|uniref:putative quinol monooxygenase n=1 Tax=Cysteiniphilum litorale TaxID=2056700 RepID=UPI003F88167A
MNIKKSDYVVCIAEIKAKKDKTNELLKVLYELKIKSPLEKGCVRYELHQDDEDPTIFTFVDRFANQAAFEYHCDQEYTKLYFDDVIPSLAESIKISTHKEIEIVAQ